MKLPVRSLTLAAALLGAPVAASAMAGDAMHGDAMHGDAMHKGATATMICRPMAAQDKVATSGDAMAAHAMIATMGSEKLVCAKIDRAAMDAESTKAKKMAHAADADASWFNFLQTQMNVPFLGTGGG